MNLYKRFLTLFKKQLPDPDVLYKLGRKLDSREQSLQERKQRIEGQLRTLHEADLHLKEMEEILKSKAIQLDGAERILNVKTEDLMLQKEKLAAEFGLLDFQKKQLDQTLSDIDFWAARIAREQVEIENEKARLATKADELSIKFLQLEKRKQALQDMEDSLRKRNDELFMREKDLTQALQEAESKKGLYEEESARINHLSEKYEKGKREVSEKEQLIERRQNDVGHREESLQKALANMRVQCSELDARELAALERIGQIEEREVRVQVREEALARIEASDYGKAESAAGRSQRSDDSSKENTVKPEVAEQTLSRKDGEPSKIEAPLDENVGQGVGLTRVQKINVSVGKETIADEKIHEEGGVEEECDEGGEGGQLAEEEQKHEKPYIKGELRKAILEELGKSNLHGDILDEQNEEIDLGARKQTRTAGHSPIVPSAMQNERVVEKDQEHRVEPPYIQMNLDERRICLILPRQKISLDEGVLDVANSVTYRATIDGLERKAEARLFKTVDRQFQTEEISIKLEKAIENFRVEFPKELKGKVFKYYHPKTEFYAFAPTAGSLAKMKYLFDADNKMNPLPRKNLWLLLRDDCHMDMAPDVEEGWIWECYRPFLVSKEKVAGLTMRTNASGSTLAIQSEDCFSLQAEGVIVDDFVENMPLFTRGQLFLKPPNVNPDGWVVWLQHKEAESRILTRDWTGQDSFRIKLPEDLPIDLGEFQLDICDQNDRIPIDSLFFRYIPLTGLEYPHELLVPGPEGFSAEVARIFFENDATDLHVITNEKAQMVENSYLIEIPREYDTASIRISKSPNLGTPCPIQITVPRVRWQINSAQEWTDIPLKIEKKEVSHECDSNLFVSFSENRHSYEVIAVLLDTSRRELQRIPVSKRGRIYSLRLNTFYDTILKSKDNMRLILRINDHQHGVKEVTVIQYVSVFECKACGFSCNERSALRQHIYSHLEHFMRKLTLEEMREYDSTLPHYIYRCGHPPCNFYSQEDALKNPTSRINAHIRNDCSFVDRRKPIQTVFSRIDDIDEVRQNVFPDLPDYRKCGLCGKRFETQDEKVQFEHLVGSHEDEMFIVT